VFSFRLAQTFVDSYVDRPVDWGYPVGPGVSLGEITFLRTYSRVKPDGSKERWHEVCQRVIDGMYSLQKDHCLANRLPWSDEQAQRSAEEAFERMFTFKWLPPGRGLWVMGTPLVMEQRNAAALQNCCFISTDDFEADDPAAPFVFLMEASMLGVGVGLDTDMSATGLRVHRPSGPVHHVVVDDSREGWVESVRSLLNAYLVEGGHPHTFDYSLIRPAGAPIKGFGGTAAGAGPLIRLHTKLTALLDAKAGLEVDTPLVADIANLIGVCVVAGNVRRSAELLLGDAEDKDFVHLKDQAWFPERNSFDSTDPGWGWMSNNTVRATVGMDYTPFVENIALNGEPGFAWMDVTRAYGRTGDAPDHRDVRAAGYNPCSEQPLESGEMCTLVEVFLNRHDDLADFKRTLKFAYMYGKTVTLLPTHWAKTNSIMQRNRRIGCSISGIAGFADTHGLPELRDWMDAGYAEVRRWDGIYSEWLCVRESIRTTTVKPSGTVSILSGSTPGVHWAPGGRTFLRTIRFSNLDPMVELLAAAGYRVEDDLVSAGTKVVYFPVATDQPRAERDVTIFEKMHLASVAQRYWSDNAVSVTISFDPEREARHIPTVLHMHEGTLKAVSFLPSGNHTYPQMPYTGIDDDEYRTAVATLAPVDLSSVYSGMAIDAAGEMYCTTDACELKVVPAAAEFESDPEANPGA
jgi:ribonucleoside-triphosphate reductase